MANIFGGSRRESELEEKVKELQSQIKNLANLQYEYQKIRDKNTELEAAYNRLKDSYRKLQEAYDTLLRKKEEPKESSIPLPPPINETAGNAGNVDLGPITDRLEKIKDMLDASSYKDTIIKELHNELQKQSRDIFSQLEQPYINALIRIHAKVSDILTKARNDYFENPSAESQNLVKILESIVLLIQDMLEDDFNIVKFEPKPGDAFDRHNHRGIQSIVTDDENLGGTIVSCYESGFQRSDNGKIVKQAVVIAYCLKK